MADAEISLIGLQRELLGRGGIRFDAELKSRVVAYARARRKQGKSIRRIATELSMTYETLRRWCARDRVTSSSRPSMREVEVTPERSSRTFAAVSPSGVRIEGLALEDAAALLRALG